jgi:hypothetical protein
MVMRFACEDVDNGFGQHYFISTEIPISHTTGKKVVLCPREMAERDFVIARIAAKCRFRDPTSLTSSLSFQLDINTAKRIRKLNNVTTDRCRSSHQAQMISVPSCNPVFL